MTDFGLYLAKVGSQPFATRRLTLCARAAPNLLVLSPHQAFRIDRGYIMPVGRKHPHQRNGDVLVEFDLHPRTGVTWVGKSPLADAAANAIAARS